MGAGTNVQDKLIAQHDLDAPWKPSDLQQRKGRMVRQGNTNDKVYLYRYVTEGTFDAYNFQLLENKATFAAQVMTNKSPLRSCDDIDDMSLDCATAKALCTGNPLIKERMDLEIDIKKLNSLKTNYLNTQFRLETELTKSLPSQIENTKRLITETEKDLKNVRNIVLPKDEKGEDKFAGITVNGVFYDDKSEGAKALLKTMRKTAQTSSSETIANYKGFSISAHYDYFTQEYKGNVIGNSCYPITYGGSDIGNFQRIENIISVKNLCEQLNTHKSTLEALESQLASAKEEFGKPFNREEELKTKTARFHEVSRQIEYGSMFGKKKDEPTEITDPYYLEVSSDKIPELEKSAVTFESRKSDTEGMSIIRFNRSDRDKVGEIVGELSNSVDRKKGMTI